MDLLAALQAADYTKAQPLIEKVLRYDPKNELMFEYSVVVQRALKRADDHAEDAADDDSVSGFLVDIVRRRRQRVVGGVVERRRRRGRRRRRRRSPRGAAGGPGGGRVAGHGRRAARERGLHPARRGEEATAKV